MVYVAFLKEDASASGSADKSQESYHINRESEVKCDCFSVICKFCLREHVKKKELCPAGRKKC